MKNGSFVILCVDDDQDVLTSLRLILEKNGYAMAEAYSAEEGARVYRETKPDFVTSLNLVDTSLSRLTEAQLRPGKAALDQVMNGLK